MPGSSTHSSASSRSRNSSIVNGKPQQHGDTQRTRTVQFGREHRQSLSLDGSRRSSSIREPRRGSRSIDLLKEETHLNEHSPLLAATERDDNPKLPPLDPIHSPSSEGTWENEEEQERQETKGSGYLLLLTLAIGG